MYIYRFFKSLKIYVVMTGRQLFANILSFISVGAQGTLCGLVLCERPEHVLWFHMANQNDSAMLWLGWLKMFLIIKSTPSIIEFWSPSGTNFADWVMSDLRGGNGRWAAGRHLRPIARYRRRTLIHRIPRITTTNYPTNIPHKLPHKLLHKLPPRRPPPKWSSSGKYIENIDQPPHKLPHQLPHQLLLRRPPPKWSSIINIKKTLASYPTN